MPRSKSAIAAKLPFRIGLGEAAMAAALDMSQGFFRSLVDAGLLPKPREAGSRRIYDVEEVTVAFRALPRQGGAPDPPSLRHGMGGGKIHEHSRSDHYSEGDAADTWRDWT
jgi:hypothetical protein